MSQALHCFAAAYYVHTMCILLHTMCILCALDILRAYSVHSACILHAYYAHTKCILRAYYAHTKCILGAYYVQTKHPRRAVVDPSVCREFDEVSACKLFEEKTGILHLGNSEWTPDRLRQTSE